MIHSFECHVTAGTRTAGTPLTCNSRTHQHAATLVSFDDSEAVFLNAQGHPLAAEACG